MESLLSQGRSTAPKGQPRSARIINQESHFVFPVNSALPPRFSFLEWSRDVPLTEVFTMGIFARLSDIITSNLNALLDRVENPEAMIAQIIREMEEGMAGAKRAAATAIAAERRVGRELEQNRGEAACWKARAREALAANREDLARRALARKQEHDDLVRSLEAQCATTSQTSEAVRTSLRALEARLAEARRKQRSILARHRAAQARVQLCRRGGVCVPDSGTPVAKFERLENRLNEFEDELAAEGEVQDLLRGLDRDFDHLRAKQDIDRELADLRRELGAEP
jgi:phage shock protein A